MPERMDFSNNEKIGRFEPEQIDLDSKLKMDAGIEREVFEKYPELDTVVADITGIAAQVGARIAYGTGEVRPSQAKERVFAERHASIEIADEVLASFGHFLGRLQFKFLTTKEPYAVESRRCADALMKKLDQVGLFNEPRYFSRRIGISEVGRFQHAEFVTRLRAAVENEVEGLLKKPSGPDIPPEGGEPLGGSGDVVSFRSARKERRSSFTKPGSLPSDSETKGDESGNVVNFDSLRKNR